MPRGPVGGPLEFSPVLLGRRKCYEMRADGISPDVRHFASTDDVYLEELRQACTRRGLRID